MAQQTAGCFGYGDCRRRSSLWAGEARESQIVRIAVQMRKGRMGRDARPTPSTVQGRARHVLAGRAQRARSFIPLRDRLTDHLLDLSTATDEHVWPARPCLGAAWGDVFDRLTILHLKRKNIGDPTAQANVTRELAEVEAVIPDQLSFPPGLAALVHELAATNAALWQIEDDIRACERAQYFDADFIALARSVYRQNDRRAELKQQISLLLGSALIEEKSHRLTEPAPRSAVE